MFIFDKGRLTRWSITNQLTARNYNKRSAMIVNKLWSFLVPMIVVLAFIGALCLNGIENSYLNRFFNPNVTHTIPPFNTTVTTYNKLDTAFTQFENDAFLFVIIFMLVVVWCSRLLSKYVFNRDKRFANSVITQSDEVFMSGKPFITVLENDETAAKEIAELDHPDRVVSHITERVPFIDFVGRYIVMYDVDNYRLKVLGVLDWRDWNVKKLLGLGLDASPDEVMSALMRRYQVGARNTDEPYVETRTGIEGDNNEQSINNYTMVKTGKGLECKVNVNVKEPTADDEKDNDDNDDKTAVKLNEGKTMPVESNVNIAASVKPKVENTTPVNPKAPTIQESNSLAVKPAHPVAPTQPKQTTALSTAQPTAVGLNKTAVKPLTQTTETTTVVPVAKPLSEPAFTASAVPVKPMKPVRSTKPIAMGVDLKDRKSNKKPTAKRSNKKKSTPVKPKKQVPDKRAPRKQAVKSSKKKPQNKASNNTRR